MRADGHFRPLSGKRSDRITEKVGHIKNMCKILNDAECFTKTFRAGVPQKIVDGQEDLIDTYYDRLKSSASSLCENPRL